MPQVSYPVDDSWVADASDQYNRCLEIAAQIQVEFIRTSRDLECIARLASALRIETGSHTVVIGAVADGRSDRRDLSVVGLSTGASKNTVSEAVWSAEVGETVRLNDGPLLAALNRRQTVVARDGVSATEIMGLPLLLDGALQGLIGLASDRRLLSDLPVRLAPALETCSVLIEARNRNSGSHELTADQPCSAPTSRESGSAPRELAVQNYPDLLQALLENVASYVAIVDAEGTIQFLNRADNGHDIEAFVGTCVFDYQMPEFRRLTRKMLRRVFTTGQAVSVDTICGGIDPGSERYCHVRAIPLRADEAVESALLIGTDLTEEQQSQKLAARHEALLHAIGEVTGEFVFVKDRDSRMVFCNSGASGFVGLTRQQQVGTDESDFYPDTVARRIREDDLRVMATGKTRTYEEVLPSDSGDRVFLTTKAPWRDSEGRVLGVVGISHDITERKQTERALAASEARLRTIIDTEPSCVCLIARDGRLLDINAAGLQMAEAESFDELRGVTMTRLVAKECRDQFEELHRRVCRGETCDAQLEIVGLKGGRRTVEHHAVPFLYSPGWRVHLGITRDVTAQRAAEETIAKQQGQLLHVSRLSTMGQMVAAISHEITQPLSAISNFAAACSLLLGQEDSEATIEEHVSAIQDQSERAGAVISRVRDFARRTQPYRSACDLRRLINDALDLARADLRRRGVTVEFSSQEPSVLVLADAVQIQQVLMNLISNACDAMQDQPETERRIWIHCSMAAQTGSSGDAVSSVQNHNNTETSDHTQACGCVEITDNGPGIDLEQASQLFDPFYTSKPQGMGIGLAICQDIIRSHGGTIEVIRTDDRGARFRFTLPSEGGATDERHTAGVSSG